MRVLYASHTAVVSGAERTLLDLIAVLPSDVEPIVASPEGDLARRVRALGLAWRPLSGTSGSLRLHPVQTPVALFGMVRSAVQLRRMRADLVHANSVRAGLIAALSRRLGGPPVIVHVHDRLERNRLTELIGRALRAGSAGFFTISAWAENGLEDQAAPRFQVGNPVDTTRFTPRMQEEGDAPTLGVVAQITPWKGQLEAIEALALVRMRVPTARLVLVGAIKFAAANTRYDNHAYLAGLKRRCSELELEGAVEFAGEREDVDLVIPTFDVLLVPSWGEPFGRSMIEAMACGVPVVATDAGGPSEVIDHGVTGLLVAPRDPAAMAGAIVDLLRDEPRRRRIGAAGREDVLQRFGHRAYAARVCAAYAQILGRPLSGMPPADA